MFLDKVPINDIFCTAAFLVTVDDLSCEIVPKCKVGVWREDNVEVTQVTCSVRVGLNVNNFHSIRVGELSVCNP